MDLPPAVAAAYLRAQDADFPLSSEPAVGRLLAVLAAAVPAGGRVLEIGTGVGVGTAWLAEGIVGRNVELVTVERDDRMAAVAACGDWPPGVRLVHGDVLDLFDELGRFDLVFADAQGGKWASLDRTIAALTPAGTLVLDDMSPARVRDDEHEDHTAEVRATVLEHPDLLAVEIGWASGVVLAARRP